MWVKICANTNLEDALAAADLGADALGFVFAASPRQVDAEQVAAITPRLPSHIERVGVFTTDDIEAIARSVDKAGLTAVQLHRGIDLPFTERLRLRLGRRISIIATTHWEVTASNASKAEVRVREDMAAVAANRHNLRLLVDAKLGRNSGGLGVSYDWAEARSALTSQPQIRIIVAGGLNPETVAHAISALTPWGVDVASGVEETPGRKSYTKLKAFIEAARGAIQTNA